jgi:hypothetical protein
MKLTRKIYKIQDVWLMLSTLRSVIFYAILFYILIVLGMLLILSGRETWSEDIKIFSIVYTVVFVLYFILVSRVFSKGYVIDLIEKEFRFPATDVENTLWGIVSFKKFRDYARVKQIALEDISDIYIDTQRVKYFSSTSNKSTKTLYTITIVGFHGSNNLNFSSKQKRDEVRTILVQAAKEVKVNVRDRKVSEFW